MKDLPPKKTCGRCKHSKPVTDFHKRGGGRPGLQSWCKQCVKEASKSPDRVAKRNEYYQQNKYKWVRNRNKFRDKDHLRLAWLNLKSRVNRTEGVNLTLTYDDFVRLMSVTNCPICGVKMLEKGSHGRNDADMKTVDRIQAGGDYSPENCVCICKRCNQIKNDGTAEEHLAIGQWMMEQRQ